MHNQDKKVHVSAIDVYLEKRKSKEFVGRLTRHKNGFEFIYKDSYLKRRKSIPLGPEFPLIQRKFHSKKLFNSFEDRIPSKQNPAYEEYCRSQGISPYEEDLLVLLGSIGRRGPSSFIFESVYLPVISGSNIAEFRKKLGLSIREFAAAFDTSTASVQKLEASEGGDELLKRLEVYVLFPGTALYEFNKNSPRLHTKTVQRVQQILEEKSNISLAETIRVAKVRGLADFIGKEIWNGDLSKMCEDKKPRQRRKRLI